MLFISECIHGMAIKNNGKVKKRTRLIDDSLYEL